VEAVFGRAPAVCRRASYSEMTFLRIAISLYLIVGA
jgi:hypothetical protein